MSMIPSSMFTCRSLLSSLRLRALSVSSSKKNNRNQSRNRHPRNQPADSADLPLRPSARSGVSFPDRARFMGYVARVIRGLIVDHTRRNSSLKRGGEFAITAQSIETIGRPDEGKELSIISDVLDELAKVEPELAEVVDLKFFCGLSFAEIAALQKLSERTVQRRWEKARLYLHKNVSGNLSF